jgi:hypothetical protein
VAGCPAAVSAEIKKIVQRFFKNGCQLQKITVMKKISAVVACCSLLFLLPGCLKDKLTHSYTILIPVYKSKTEVYANVKSNSPQPIQSPGKIFVYGNYIFLNEIDKGVHIIDNRDPANPVAKAFIDIPGNLDIAVKGNTLYADMYGDLVAVDISDPLNAKLLKSVPGVFPERSYENGFVADNSRIIIGWIRKDTTVEIKPSRDYIVYTGPVLNGQFLSAAPASTPSGISGSMARFALVDNYLYAVDHHNLESISISNANDPVLVSTMNAGWDIETIYPLKDKLFLGSMGGIFIFNISNPAAPVAEGNFVHARACDPVVADNKYAFITLRAGTDCGPVDDELQIVDVTNLTSPTLLKAYPMTNPYGLSKDGNHLFICDGTGGLKVYDASDPGDLQLIKTISGMDTYDVIAYNNIALVVAKDGLYQYDYSDINNIHLLSRIVIAH